MRELTLEEINAHPDFEVIEKVLPASGRPEGYNLQCYYKGERIFSKGLIFCPLSSLTIIKKKYLVLLNGKLKLRNLINKFE